MFQWMRFFLVLSIIILYSNDAYTECDSLKLEQLEDSVSRHYQRIGGLDKTIKNLDDKLNSLSDAHKTSKTNIECITKIQSYIFWAIPVLLGLFGLALFKNYAENRRVLKFIDETSKYVNMFEEGIKQQLGILNKITYKDVISSQLDNSNDLFDEQERKEIQYQIEKAEVIAISFKNYFSKNDVESLQVFTNIAQYYLKYRNYHKAKMFFELILNTNPDAWYGHFGIGFTHHKIGQIYPSDSIKQNEHYNIAIQCYQKSISINNLNWEPYHNLGWIYDEYRSYELAINNYKRAFELKGNEETIPFNIACSYSKYKNYTEVLKYLKIAKSIWPPNKSNNFLSYVQTDPDLLWFRVYYVEDFQELVRNSYISRV